MQHIIDLEDFNESWGAKDDHNGINIIHPLTIVDGNAQMLGRTRGENIDGVGHATAWQQLFLEFFGNRSTQWGHVHTTLREGIRQHHARTAGMGNYCYS